MINCFISEEGGEFSPVGGSFGSGEFSPRGKKNDPLRNMFCSLVYARAMGDTSCMQFFCGKMVFLQKDAQLHGRMVDEQEGVH